MLNIQTSRFEQTVYPDQTPSFRISLVMHLMTFIGIRSKRPQVKTAPSQNGPKLVKTAPTAVADWSKRPPKKRPQKWPQIRPRILVKNNVCKCIFQR